MKENERVIMISMETALETALEDISETGGSEETINLIKVLRDSGPGHRWMEEVLRGRGVADPTDEISEYLSEEQLRILPRVTRDIRDIVENNIKDQIITLDAEVEGKTKSLSKWKQIVGAILVLLASLLPSSVEAGPFRYTGWQDDNPATILQPGPPQNITLPSLVDVQVTLGGDLIVNQWDLYDPSRTVVLASALVPFSSPLETIGASQWSMDEMTINNLVDNISRDRKVFFRDVDFALSRLVTLGTNGSSPFMWEIDSGGTTYEVQNLRFTVPEPHPFNLAMAIIVTIIMTEIVFPERKPVITTR